MDAISQIISNAVSRMESQSKTTADYINTDDGLTYCGKCHTRKQVLVNWVGVMRKMPCVCACKQAEYLKNQEDEEKRELMRRIERLRESGITDSAYLNNTFVNDDYKYPDVSAKCRDYVKHFDKMCSNNIGLLLFGGVGTGKTFYACCIANELLSQGISALVTSFPKMLNYLQGCNAEAKDELFTKIQIYKVVVIDDLGVERDTSYGYEQIFNVIDSRVRSGKPLIVTTNLSPNDVVNTNELRLKRIYDRILECCVAIKVTGESRRIAKHKSKTAIFDSIIGG